MPFEIAYYISKVRSTLTIDPHIFVLWSNVDWSEEVCMEVTFGEWHVMMREMQLQWFYTIDTRVRGLPVMTSALRGEGGTFKSRHSKQP